LLDHALNSGDLTIDSFDPAEDFITDLIFHGNTYTVYMYLSNRRNRSGALIKGTSNDNEQQRTSTPRDGTDDPDHTLIFSTTSEYRPTEAANP
jgi:hypothetical protein